MKRIDLIILAGGKGSRISKITKRVPKPMIKFNNLPFIKHLLNFYSKYNFENIYILAGYKSKIIENYFSKLKRINSVNIKVLKEKNLQGTGGSLNLLKNKKINDFILINGDTYFELDQRILNKMKNTKKLGSLFLIRNDNYKSNKKLSNFQAQFYGKKINLMNSGLIFFKKKILKKIPIGTSSLEDDVIPKLIKLKKINIIKFKKKIDFIDIGTYKNLKEAKNFFKRKINPAVFLDRDGVINVLKPYIFRMRDFKLKSNVIAAFKFLNQRKINIFIVTNQAGIAKNKFSEKQYLYFEKQIKEFFLKKGVFISDTKYSPFHKLSKIKKFRKNSILRKPGNGMIKKLNKEWSYNQKLSLMIGDKYSDKMAAKKSSLKFEYEINNLKAQVLKYYQ